MNSPQCAGALQQAMGAITEAYSVLSHDEKRATYDRKLAHSQMHTEEEENTRVLFSSGHKLPPRWKRNVRDFLVSQVREPYAGGRQVSCVPGNQLGDAEPLSPRSSGTLSEGYRTRPAEPTRLLAARGTLRRDAIAVASRAVVLMDPGHGVARQRLAVIDDQANKKSRLGGSFFNKRR